MSIATLNPSSELSSEPPLQVLLRRERDGMERDVEAAPGLADLLEDGFELASLPHVAGREDRGPEFLGERLDVRPGLLVEVGDREVGPELAEDPGAAVGNRMLVGDADDEGTLALQNLRLDRDFGQFGGLIVHELALVRRLSLAAAVGPLPCRRLTGTSTWSSTSVTVIGLPFASPSVPSSERRRRISPSKLVLLGIGLDPALQAVEQIEQAAPVL